MHECFVSAAEPLTKATRRMVSSQARKNILAPSTQMRAVIETCISTRVKGLIILPSPPQYQPPCSTGPPPADVDKYADYADLDELEEILPKEASNPSPPPSTFYQVALKIR